MDTLGQHLRADTRLHGVRNAPGAVGDKQDHAGRSRIVGGEHAERHIQPAADIGVGKAFLRHRRHGRRHRSAMLGERHDQDGIGRKGHQAKTILRPPRKKRLDQPCRRRRLARPGFLSDTRKTFIHAQTAIENQHHVGAAPDAFDLVGAAMQAGEPQHDRSHYHGGQQPQSAIDPGRHRIARHRHQRRYGVPPCVTPQQRRQAET
jgi:hypothetical protein